MGFRAIEGEDGGQIAAVAPARLWGRPDRRRTDSRAFGTDCPHLSGADHNYTCSKRFYGDRYGFCGKLPWDGAVSASAVGSAFLLRASSNKCDTPDCGGGILKDFAAVLVTVSLLGFPAIAAAVQSQPAPTQPSAASSSPSITIPSGTKIELVVTRPEWADSAKEGDTIYGQTSFPVVAGGTMGIPAGTYVEGTIESVTQTDAQTAARGDSGSFYEDHFCQRLHCRACPAAATAVPGSPDPGGKPPAQGKL